MNRQTCLAVALLLLLLPGGCQSHQEYDLSDGIDSKITLFEKALVLPVGSTAPFTLKMAMQPLSAKLPLWGLPTDLLKVDENGQLQIFYNQELTRFNFYKFALSVPDNADPYVWKPDEMKESPTMEVLLPMLGIWLHNETLALTVTAPFSEGIWMDGTVSVVCKGENEEVAYQEAVRLDRLAVSPSEKDVQLALFRLPIINQGSEADVAFQNMEVLLPAHFAGRITGDGIYTIHMAHQANVSVGSQFELSLPKLEIPVHLPLGAVGFRDAVIELELENTLPMQVAITELAVPGNGNLSITTEGTLAGGSPATPAASRLSLHIKSLDGSPIPDIELLALQVNLRAAPGLENVLLSENQGVRLKHSYVKVNGGITLFGHEN